jgi:hypothetical protein
MSPKAFSKLSRIAAIAAAGILASCVSTGTATIDQPDLTALAQPYAARLQAANIYRIETPRMGGGQLVSVETPDGYFYIRYREGLASTPFVLTARDNRAMASSDTYVPAQLPQYRETIDWVVPEVLRVAPRKAAELRLIRYGSGR